LNLKQYSFFIILIIISVELFSQDVYRRPYADVQKDFEYTFSSMKAGEGKNIINVVVEIPYDLINFLKSKSLYTGEYEITVYIYDHDYRLIADTTESEEIILSDFEKTNSRKLYSVHSWNFPVREMTDYKVKINFLDKNTKEEINIEKNYKTRKFKADEIDLSDLIFYKTEYDSVNDVKKLVPQFREFSSDEKYLIFFEVYNKNKNDKIKVEHKIFNSKNKDIINIEFEHKIKSSTDSVYIEIDMEKITSGKYSAEVRVRDKDNERKREREFTVMWHNYPKTKAELDKAVKQMKYIQSGNVYEDMKDLSYEKKMEAFCEFWNSRDPSAGTKRNEIMEEYFWRIYFANKHFSTYNREGWNTDRGMIFIIFGPPDEAYDKPFAMGGDQYQVWVYYYINREILFIDEHNTGNYRLYFNQEVPYQLGDMYNPGINE